MSTFTNSRPVRAVAAWLCATFAIGCPAAQVMPPEIGTCSREARERMAEAGLLMRIDYGITLDINQPGSGFDRGVYHPGPIVSRVESSDNPSLPEGTLLYGQLWTEGLHKYGKPAVAGRYHEALLPNGRHIAPICFLLNDQTGLEAVNDIGDTGFKPDAVILSRYDTALPDLHYW